MGLSNSASQRESRLSQKLLQFCCILLREISEIVVENDMDISRIR